MLLYHPQGGVRVRGFYLRTELARSSPGEGLTRLLRLMVGGRLRPRIAVEADWHDIGSIARRLMDRQITGKAVLHLSR